MIVMIKKVFIRHPLRSHPVPSTSSDITPLVDEDELPEGGNKMVVLVFVFLVCLLYTSDAADERSSVDLGGRRIFNKKHKYNCDASRRTLDCVTLHVRQCTL